MINIRTSKYEELAVFSKMEKQPHASKYINPTTLSKHQKDFKEQKFVYLSIEKITVGVIGYFILVIEENRDTIEFRRVLVDENQKGIGQAAIKQMEKYCKLKLNAKRIWLDVYEDNDIGKHIYEKLGYKLFKTEESGSRFLLFYNKEL